MDSKHYQPSTTVPWLTLRPATEEDVKAILPHLRSADVIEALAFGNVDDVIMESFRLSDETWVALNDGRPIALFGVGRTLWSHGGTIWAVGTYDIRAFAKSLTTVAKAFIASWLEDYKTLSNVVWKGNTPSIRWLKTLGFTFDIPQPDYAGSGMTFIRFTKTNV